jgi:hypothetical protein
MPISSKKILIWLDIKYKLKFGGVMELYVINK